MPPRSPAAKLMVKLLLCSTRWNCCLDFAAGGEAAFLDFQGLRPLTTREIVTSEPLSRRPVQGSQDFGRRSTPDSADAPSGAFGFGLPYTMSSPGLTRRSRLRFRLMEPFHGCPGQARG